MFFLWRGQALMGSNGFQSQGTPLQEGDPCVDLEPGTFDWHALKPNDPFPKGNSGGMCVHICR